MNPRPAPARPRCVADAVCWSRARSHQVVDRFTFAGYDLAHKLNVTYAVHSPTLLLDLDDPPAHVAAPFSGMSTKVSQWRNFTLHTHAGTSPRAGGGRPLILFNHPCAAVPCPAELVRVGAVPEPVLPPALQRGNTEQPSQSQPGAVTRCLPRHKGRCAALLAAYRNS